MPIRFWDEAFKTACFLINRMPSKTINMETPLERLFHEKPDYSFLKTFGSACWPCLRPYNNRKLQFRSKRCVFLGYSTLHKGYKCLHISSGRVYISRDVVFNEDIFPYFDIMPPTTPASLHDQLLLSPTSFPYSSYPSVNAANDRGNQSRDDFSSNPVTRDPFVPSMQVTTDPGGVPPRAHVDRASCMRHEDEDAEPSQAEPAPEPASSPGPPSPAGPPGPSSPVAAHDQAPPSPGAASPPHDETPPPAAPPRYVTRLRDNTWRPKVITDGTVPYGLPRRRRQASLAITEPRSHLEAATEPNWRRAMDEEYQALLDNRTWHLVPPLPRCNLIDCRWVFKLKHRADGTIDRS